MLDVTAGTLFALFAQATPPITGNAEADGWIRLGVAGVFIWFLIQQNKKQSEDQARDRAKADADKDALLREVMKGVQNTFAEGFNNLQAAAKATGGEIRDLKQWIIDEIQDARKVRDSDPTRKDS